MGRGQTCDVKEGGYMLYSHATIEQDLMGSRPPNLLVLRYELFWQPQLDQP